MRAEIFPVSKTLIRRELKYWEVANSSRRAFCTAVHQQLPALGINMEKALIRCPWPEIKGSEISESESDPKKLDEGDIYEGRVPQRGDKCSKFGS